MGSVDGGRGGGFLVTWWFSPIELLFLLLGPAEDASMELPSLVTVPHTSYQRRFVGGMIPGDDGPNHSCGGCGMVFAWVILGCSCAPWLVVLTRSL